MIAKEPFARTPHSSAPLCIRSASCVYLRRCNRCTALVTLLAVPTLSTSNSQHDVLCTMYHSFSSSCNRVNLTFTRYRHHRSVSEHVCVSVPVCQHLVCRLLTMCGACACRSKISPVCTRTMIICWYACARCCALLAL